MPTDEDRQRAKIGYGNGQVENDNVATPKAVLDEIVRLFGTYFDPCPLNPQPTQDGLSISWAEHAQGRVVFVNPPYSNIAPWLAKGAEEWEQNGVQSVFLIPARVSSKYWADYVFSRATDVFFFQGNLIFEGFDKRAPFPSSMVYYGPPTFPIPHTPCVAIDGFNSYHRLQLKTLDVIGPSVQNNLDVIH